VNENYNPVRHSQDYSSKKINNRYDQENIKPLEKVMMPSALGLPPKSKAIMNSVDVLHNHHSRKVSAVLRELQQNAMMAD